MSKLNRTFIFWILMAFVFAFALSNLGRSGSNVPSVAYSQFLQDVKAGRVEEVYIQGQQARARMADGKTARTFEPGDPGLVGDLIDNGVTIRAQPPERPGPRFSDGPIGEHFRAGE